MLIRERCVADQNCCRVWERVWGEYVHRMSEGSLEDVLKLPVLKGSIGEVEQEIEEEREALRGTWYM